jgi:mono/diheme cytochrome c family protein
MRSGRCGAILLSVGAAVLLALALSLAASLISVAAPTKPRDVVATRSYLIAELAANEALATNDRAGAIAVEELAASLKRECPAVAANAPSDSPSREKLLYETAYAAVLAYISPIRAALRSVLDTEAQLRWSERMLTLLVHGLAARNALVEVSPPDLCRDWRAWAASGFKNVPTATTSFLTQVGPTIVASFEAHVAYGPGVEAVIEGLLKPYEGPSERRLQRRVDHLRRLARSRVPTGALVALRKIETALGLREHALGHEQQGAALIPPPSAVVQADGKRLEEFYAGRAVAVQSGCLACHRIGEYGNEGPGPDLTHIASRLRSHAIARTLVRPTAPMPSFRHLPRAKFTALVEFLSLLR